MKKGSHWWIPVAAALVLMTARPAAAVLSDIIGHWAAPLIGALQARGVVSGDENGLFHPEDPLTRAEMAKLLTVSLGREEDAELLAGYDSRFVDVPDNHWAKGYIEALAETGLTVGYDRGRFGPEDPVTRAQMAVFLIRAAGLTEQANQYRFEATSYKDDAALPDWARGAIHVALDAGLMAGFEDQTFRPDAPITRAEGSTTLLRLLAVKGRAYNLAGTLVDFDSKRREGVVRDELGQERAFEMAADAVYYRGGSLAAPREIEPLDQVWIILDESGKGRFMEARFSDLLGTGAVVVGDTLRLTVNGQERLFTFQPGALLFYNGRPAALDQIDGAQQVYLALDRQTGQVRVLDAVNTPVHGELAAVDEALKRMTLYMGEQTQTYSFSRDALLLLNGEPADLADLEPGDSVRLALDEAGQVVYLMAER